MSLDNKFLNYSSWCRKSLQNQERFIDEYRTLAKVWRQSANITF